MSYTLICHQACKDTHENPHSKYSQPFKEESCIGQVSRNTTLVRDGAKEQIDFKGKLQMVKVKERGGCGFKGKAMRERKKKILEGKKQEVGNGEKETRMSWY